MLKFNIFYFYLSANKNSNKFALLYFKQKRTKTVHYCQILNLNFDMELIKIFAPTFLLQ